jgi:hypothetical protein
MCAQDLGGNQRLAVNDEEPANIAARHGVSVRPVAFDLTDP